jgi:hypothetical protein
MTPKRLVIASLTVLTCMATPVWLTAQEAADVEAEIATAPVELDNAVLFRVRGCHRFPLRSASQCRSSSFAPR